MAGAIAALVVLNASLTFANVWPTPKVRWTGQLSLEVAVAVLLLAAAGQWAAPLARRVLPIVWVVLVLGHYIDVTAPGLYGREFNLYWDSAHLGNVVAMLARDVPAWMLAVGVTMAVGGVAIVWVVARVAWGVVASAMTVRLARRVLSALALMVIGLFIESPPRPTDRPESRAFANPVSVAYARQARYVLAMAMPGRAAPTLADSPDLSGDLGALEGADVVLAFVEAYGAVTHDNPVLADALAPARAELSGAIDAAGRVVVSAYVDSPTFGASSWLAHLTLLTGVEARDQYAYVAVMSSSRDTLPKAFRRQGYRSVALMPGMRQAWPEGAFYGFDRIYDRGALAYPGPHFGWWSIPDQFTLAKFEAEELRGTDRAPVFAVFPTSTTHAPFGPVPPYQPDWSRVLGPAAFEAADVERAMQTAPDLLNLSPSYARAMAYELTAFAGYLRQHAGDSLVLILIGDHQPVAAVSGPGASYEVPIHVIARPGVVTDSLRAAGFTDGLAPRRPALGPMHALVPILMRAFGR